MTRHTGLGSQRSINMCDKQIATLIGSIGKQKKRSLGPHRFSHVFFCLSGPLRYDDFYLTCPQFGCKQHPPNKMTFTITLHGKTKKSTSRFFFKQALANVGSVVNNRNWGTVSFRLVNNVKVHGIGFMALWLVNHRPPGHVPPPEIAGLMIRAYENPNHRAPNHLKLGTSPPKKLHQSCMYFSFGTSFLNYTP